MKTYPQNCKLFQWSEGLFSLGTKGKICLVFASLLFTTRCREKIWWRKLKECDGIMKNYSTRQRQEVHAVHSVTATLASKYSPILILQLPIDWNYKIMIHLFGYFLVIIVPPVHRYICDPVNILNTHPLTHTDMTAQLNTTTSIFTQWPQARNHAYITSKASQSLWNMIYAYRGTYRTQMPANRPKHSGNLQPAVQSWSKVPSTLVWWTLRKTLSEWEVGVSSDQYIHMALQRRKNYNSFKPIQFSK